MERFHHVLRDATASMHASLDGRLRGAFEKKESYAAFLRASHGAVSAVESAILRLAPPVFVPAAGRLACLSSDLAELGAGAALTNRATNASESSFCPMTTAEALGAAYVVEGSSLGGMFLAKLVDAALSLDGRAVGYLTFHGVETGPKWKAFLERLEAWSTSASAEERGATVASARATFQAYRVAFESEGLVG